MHIKLERSAFIRMIDGAVRAHGLSLADFLDLGRSGALDNPTLRDLWLIWGDELDLLDTL